MADILEFPDKIPGAKDIAITLNGTEWMAIALTLAGRKLSATHRRALDSAEEKLMDQLRMEG